MSLSLALWSMDVQVRLYGCVFVYVCEHQLEGRWETTEQHTCLWLWSVCVGSIPRAKGTKNILHLTLTRLINADPSASILEPFKGKSTSHTFRSKVLELHLLSHGKTEWSVGPHS